MLEFALGHHREASAPKAFHLIDPKWEWLGWWAVLFVMFGIELYYIVIIGWCGNYMVFSAFQSVSDPNSMFSDPNAFFFSDFLAVSGDKVIADANSIVFQHLGSDLSGLLASAGQEALQDVNGVFGNDLSSLLTGSVDRVLADANSVLSSDVHTQLHALLIKGRDTVLADANNVLLKTASQGPAALFSASLDKVVIESKRILPAVWNLGMIRWPIAIAVSLIWLINWTITYRGIKQGIERAVKIMMPLLILITVSITLWAIFLPGAKMGIKHYITPDFSRITDLDVWIGAYGQIFFSLSLGFGIMITYSSYLPRDANLFKNSLIVGFSNSFYEVFAGFGVFSILGYMATQQQTSISEVVKSGIGLAFVAYPTAIAMLPFGRLFGVLFFFLLLIAGISSSISIIEAFTSAVTDKFNVSRKKVITYVCVVGFLGSLMFTTNAGLIWLDIVDHFLNQYGLIVVGIVEALVVGWLYRTDLLKSHIVANLGLSGTHHKFFKYVVLQLWMYCIRFITPVALGIAIVNSLMQEFVEPYAGYPVSGVLFLGVGWILITHVVAFGFSGLPWKRSSTEQS
jgi:NSS family neurotransmitter:Na+ symporter